MFTLNLITDKTKFWDGEIGIEAAVLPFKLVCCFVLNQVLSVMNGKMPLPFRIL